MRPSSPVFLLLLAIPAMALHVWLAKWSSDPSWIAAGGDLLIVFGAISVARSFLREGRRQIGPRTFTARRVVTDPETGRLVSATPDKDWQETLDSIASVVVGPALVIVGTLINGYGGIVGTWWLKK